MKLFGFSKYQLAKIRKSIFLFATYLLTASSGICQTMLTLQEAINRSLNNNYEIRIGRNDSIISSNNNTIGRAGFLPSIDIESGLNHSKNNTRQEYVTGTAVDRNGAGSQNVNAAVRLNWTLFDGMQMFASRSRLQLEESATSFELKSKIEQTVAGTIESYFEVARIQQSIKVADESMRMADERLRIAQARFESGAASRLDFLQARVDRNASQAEKLRLANELAVAFSKAGQQMGNRETDEFIATDTITITYQPDLIGLKQYFKVKNSEVLLQDVMKDISVQRFREMRAQRLPRLSAGINYGYNETKNDAGFLLYNQNDGLSAGLTLSWNIFSGFKNSANSRNARIEISSSKLMMESVISRISHELAAAYTRFESEKTAVILEADGIRYARENAETALEAFRLGAISGIQLREAQVSYQLAMQRLLDARYRAKVAETELMRLNGDLLR